MRSGVDVRLGPAAREWLEAVVADRNSLQKHVWRARIVLMTADGHGTNAIQEAIGTAKPTVWRWQARFMAEGVAGMLRDKTRPPGKAPLAAEVADWLVALTLAKPPGEVTHGTSRAMAATFGIAASTVQKVWRACGLAPHRIRTFKLSNDPQFEAKVRDVVGLYVDPPEHAVVLSVDDPSTGSG